MIITLILLIAFLALEKHLGLESLLVYCLKLPLSYYIGSLILLVVLRVALAIYKYLPLARRLVRSLLRLSEQVDVTLPGGNPTANGTRPGKGLGNQTRGMATKASPSPKSRSDKLFIRGSLKTRGPVSHISGERRKVDKPKTYSKFRLFALTSKAVNAMSRRNAGRSLINSSLAVMVISGLSFSSGRLRAVVSVTRFISHLVETRGAKGATQYLKGAAVFLQQAIGGHIEGSSKAFGPGISRTNSGLPRIIPSLHREMIRKGDTRLMKFYLSIFNLYRLFDWVGPTKIGTITKPDEGTHGIPLGEYITPFLECLPGTSYLQFRTDLMENFRELKLFNIFKSGPNTEDLHNINTHPVTVAGSARMLQQHPNLYSSMLLFLKACPARMYESFVWLANNIPSHVGMHAREWRLLTGKLGFKQEAAGKVRVFAMVDAWTQWVLNPLHKALFSVLAKIPQDGTFDQMRPVKLLFHKGNLCSSLDLSAATDRLPVTLQADLLARLVNGPFATAWRELLVGRSYYGYHKTLLPQSIDVKYSVGQPMGALSSWAMLAFVHHFIVQAAAWRSGIVPLGTWYTNYAVLGDDLVIGDREVASEYLKILRSLGVECGLHKSLLAQVPDTLEFAKRTFYKGQDVSPVPFKELRAASISVGASAELATKYNLSRTTLLKAFGYGYKVLARLNAPVGSLNGKVRELVLNELAPKSLSEVRAFLMLGAPRHAKWAGGEPMDSYPDLHQYFASGDHLKAADLKRLFIQRQVKPMLQTVNSLIGEFRDKVSILKQVKRFSNDLIGYYRGVNLSPPDPRVLAKSIMFIWNGTHALPNAKARNGIMRLKKDLEFIIDNPLFFSFEELYWDNFLMKKELSSLPLDIVRFVRKLDPEIIISQPHHNKMWKAWAGYAQGTQSLPPKEVVERAEFKEMPIVPGGGTNPNPLFLMAESLGLW